MRAVCYEAATRFEVRDVATPEPGPGEVLVRVLLAGVCGTDHHVHHGGFGAVFPLTPGHEVVGSVAALGDGVDTFAVGEQVSVNPNVYCGRCVYCRAGRLGLCSAMSSFGVTRDGFFAEYAVAPATQVFSVDGLPLDTAVFTEPTACAMHGVETLAVRPGATALVIGAGPTGQLLAQLIASGGASSVTVAAPRPYELETATALGASQTVAVIKGDPQGNLARLRAASGTDGYDIVVEATGSTEVGDLCVPLTRNGGTVLVYGVANEDARLSISPYEVFRRELTVKGSFAEITSFGAAIAALRAGRVRTDGIISHRFGLDDYGVALQTLAEGQGPDGVGAHKVVITA